MEGLPIDEPRTRTLHSRLYFLRSSSICRSMEFDFAVSAGSAVDMEPPIVEGDEQVVSGGG